MSKSFILLVAALPILSAPASYAACKCGPDFCQDDPRIAATLAKKKTALRPEYPERLIALLDKGNQCVARIERSPNGFSLWEVKADGSKQSVPWTQDDENIALKQASSGAVSRFWIINTREAFSCCGELAASARPDWDATDGVSKNQAIFCDSNGCR